MTVEATVGPAARTTPRLSTYAKPVPSAPSASSATAAGTPGQCGRPASAGATTASSTLAQTSWAADSAAAEPLQPAKKRCMYANVAP